MRSFVFILVLHDENELTICVAHFHHSKPQNHIEYSHTHTHTPRKHNTQSTAHGRAAVAHKRARIHKCLRLLVAKYIYEMLLFYNVIHSEKKKQRRNAAPIATIRSGPESAAAAHADELQIQITNKRSWNIIKKKNNKKQKTELHQRPCQPDQYMILFFMFVRFCVY